ncbi:MAG: RagB/SusD family nutrient uptake outer membrane protein, partial [Prevotellaceae bacterium]|nr:RagB/SusD family nutrient uptake outer membrane protein [Prevotellaceae bacterium]
PADECFDYIVELLDQAIPNLPLKILNPMDELGRITRPIAASLKAKVLVTAASPLFNGNADQATLKNKDGRSLFNPEVSKAKWDSAVIACREAIAICDEADIVLYKYEQRAVLSDTILRQLTLRNTFTEKWNSEIIWANTQTATSEIQYIQLQSTPNLEKAKYPDNSNIRVGLNPPVKMAELYYTNNGVPIGEDKSWQLLDPFALRVGGATESYYIKKDYTTIQLHFDREPRFYASLGFDGGLWYGQSVYGNNPSEYFHVACRNGGLQGRWRVDYGPYTGYFQKKVIHFENVQPNMSGYTIVNYPWPIMRLADLFLLYAEAINEAEGPSGPNSGEMFKFIDSIRSKAGLRGVKYSWDNYASTKKYETQIGMRAIIHRERLIELSFEGQRFWDLRRWKEAPAEFEKNIEAYDLNEGDPAKFYQRVILAKQPYSVKDYFWPIQTSYIENNPNLIQNIGW